MRLWNGQSPALAVAGGSDKSEVNDVQISVSDVICAAAGGGHADQRLHPAQSQDLLRRRRARRLPRRPGGARHEPAGDQRPHQGFGSGLGLPALPPRPCRLRADREGRGGLRPRQGDAVRRRGLRGAPRRAAPRADRAPADRPRRQRGDEPGAAGRGGDPPLLRPRQRRRAQPRHRHPRLVGEGAADRRHPARHRPLPDAGAEPRLPAGLGGGPRPLLRPPPPVLHHTPRGDHAGRARALRDDRAPLPAPRGARRLGRPADRCLSLEHGGTGDPDRQRPVPRLPADALRPPLGRLGRDARHRPPRHRMALPVPARHPRPSAAATDRPGLSTGICSPRCRRQRVRRGVN